MEIVLVKTVEELIGALSRASLEGWSKKARQPEQRAGAYRAFLADVHRARFRVQLVMQVHAARTRSLSMVGGAGFSAQVHLVDRFADDMTGVVASWERVHHVGAGGVKPPADELLRALAALAQPPLGVLAGPRKRQKAARAQGEAEHRFQGTLSSFLTAAHDDVGDELLPQASAG